MNNAECVALTGDHWTSLSNSEYLGVVAHFIDPKWDLQSFALTIHKASTRHFADNVAEVSQKATTDRVRTMVAAMRQLTDQHMPCVAEDHHSLP